ncbi:hypothetical protein ACTFIV_007040 [Dictyostelium citrinum]
MNTEGSYKCTYEFCGLTFEYSSSLSRHVTKKHGGAGRIKSVSKRPKVMCRHSDCTVLCNTNHRRRHEKCHKNLCKDLECPACTNPEQFKRGRRPINFKLSSKRQLNYLSIENLIN